THRSRVQDSTSHLELADLFSFHQTAPPMADPLSLHDALPILVLSRPRRNPSRRERRGGPLARAPTDRWPRRRPNTADKNLPSTGDRKSTRLNSSHLGISYAVFCLKKKTKQLVFCVNPKLADST